MSETRKTEPEIPAWVTAGITKAEKAGRPASFYPAACAYAYITLHADAFGAERTVARTGAESWLRAKLGLGSQKYRSPVLHAVLQELADAYLREHGIDLPDGTKSKAMRWFPKAVKD
ncbi:hypothetical protein [Nonomuraea gerenzanensis]|uniref:Uncharacterized protein n=1 Tax=Nonomuraea gerenzanensis TaxID=93944 RepID=A0A1M4EEF0_9ACTN|nr:hypothetical protein [Nonomuraea gerenzanensis]UBU08894.1 hypothetical protein LCN96_31465 [Nonomuraea gerenzanensis]SBO97269.1 hypothetical protein BN4615_P6785 [Nonomuraea gerenzanensis]